MSMLFFFIYGVFIFSFMYTIAKKGLKTLFYLPFYWMLAEILNVYFYSYDSDGTINALTLVYIIYVAFKLRFKIITWNVFLSAFLIIAFIKTPFLIDFVSFGNRYINLFNIYMILPISYFVISKYDDIRKITNVVFITLSIVNVYIIVSSIIKVGPNMYNTDIIYGLKWGQLYGPALMSFIIVIQSRSIEKYKLAKNVALMADLLIVLSLRRTAILIVVSTFLIYFIITYKWKRIFYIIAIATMLIGIISILKNTRIINNSLRQSKFTSYYDIRGEGRYFDIISVYNLLKQSNVTLSGVELFNDYGKYGAKRDTRPIHSDIMRLLYGIGLIGVVPLLLALSIIIKRILCFRKSREIKGFGIALIVAFCFTMASGGTLYISYTGLLFIYLGAVLRMMHEENYDYN